MTNANFPLTADGYTMHLGCKRGEVCNRVITVGSAKRAELLSSMLDKTKKFENTSERGFVTHTGTYKGVPVSIVAIGMGMPNMDIFVREARAIVSGRMLFVRVGTCGTPHTEVNIGDLVIAAKGSILLQRNAQAFTDHTSENYYNFCSAIPSDPELSQLLAKAVKNDKVNYHEAMNATADYFYPTQGRIDRDFEDHNEGIITKISTEYPEVKSLEMETFHLLDLARISVGTIRASAIAIVLAQRKTNAFLSNEEINKMEEIAGRATLTAITSCSLPEKELMHGPYCVWEKN